MGRPGVLRSRSRPANTAARVVMVCCGGSTARRKWEGMTRAVLLAVLVEHSLVYNAVPHGAASSPGTLVPPEEQEGPSGSGMMASLRKRGMGPSGWAPRRTHAVGIATSSRRDPTGL